MGQALRNTFENITKIKNQCIKECFEKPKVSIIIPIYNVEQYIDECFNSLIGQTLKELEFICIDDGSTDDSYEILKEYAQNDARFVILKQNREGQGIGRNKCIEQAKGEYIAFVDPDDKLELNAIEELYNYAKLKNAQVVQFNYTKFGEHKKKKINNFYKKYKKKFGYNLLKTNKYNWKDLKKDNLLVDIDYHVWTRFYSADYVKENQLQFSPTTNGEDHLFVIGMLFNAKEIFFLNKSLYLYRLRNSSTTNAKSDKSFCVFTNIDLAENLLKEMNLLPELNTVLKKYKLHILQCHYNQTPDESIPKYMEQAEKCLAENEFKDFKALLNKPKFSFIKRIFSVLQNN